MVGVPALQRIVSKDSQQQSDWADECSEDGHQQESGCEPSQGSCGPHQEQKRGACECWVEDGGNAECCDRGEAESYPGRTLLEECRSAGSDAEEQTQQSELSEHSLIGLSERVCWRAYSLRGSELLINDQEVFKYKHVESGCVKAGKGIFRVTNDGFTTDIETGVYQHWTACEIFEVCEQSMQSGVPIAIHGLDSGGRVHMCHGGNQRPGNSDAFQQIRGVKQCVAVWIGQWCQLIGLNLCGEEHVGEIGIGFGFEPSVDLFPEHDRGKRTEAFAEFDLQIEDSLDGV